MDVIDIFAGVGGLSYGLETSGLNVLKGFDIEKSCQTPYNHNCQSTLEIVDVKDLKGETLNRIYNENNTKIKILVGCAPCQPFSSYQKKTDHPDTELINEFLRLILEVKPHIISMENVAGMQKDVNFINFVDTLRENKYLVDYKVINIANYGLPQNRKRLVLLASKKGEIKVPEKTVERHTTLFEAIGHLSPIDAGENNTVDNLHVSPRLSDTNLQRIIHSLPGGTWRDWPEALLPECYRRESGRTFSSVYGRLSPDKPSNTITTQFNRYGSGRFGHFQQNRALTLREGAILQSFPDHWNFDPNGNLPKTKIARMIGNAVPPLLGQVIGETIINHIEKGYFDE